MKLEILLIEKVEPTYILTVYYMIGDADGDTEESIEFEKLDEPLIKLIRILIKLDGYEPKGHWGFIFDEHHLNHALSEGVLTEDEITFLDSGEYNKSEAFDDFSDDIIRNSYCDDREFLVYQGFDITYRDSNNCIHYVSVVDETNKNK